MTKYANGLALGVALVVATVGVAQNQKADPQKDVLDVARVIEEGKGANAVQAKVKAIKAKGYDLDELMKVYKLKEKGGLGFGEKPAAKSGIEAKIQALTKGLPAATLKKESKDLLKLADVNLAMAEITRPHFVKPMEGKGKKDWDKWLDDQAKASKDLIDAVKAQDGKAVAKAARQLQNACTECHATFRQ